MRFLVDAACGCNIGKVRRNNEDNFFFDDKCLELDNQGLRNTACFSDTLKNGLCFAIFDGMGGENFGEVASFTAARQMQTVTRSLSDYFVSERKYLLKLTAQLNDAIVEAKKELCTDRCGSTMVSLYFSSGYVYTCNIGDSRAYRLRDGEFLQLSVDHVEKRPEGERKKVPLTQSSAKPFLYCEDLSNGYQRLPFCAKVVTWAQVSGVNPNVYSSEETGRIGISR